MSAGITRKELKRDELVDATIEAGHWLERHWRTVAGGAGVLLLAALGIGGWSWNSQRQRERVGRLLGEATVLYRKSEDAGFARSDLELALAKLDEAVKIDGRGEPARLVHYWRGSALFRMGRAEEAAAELERVASDAGAPASLAGAAQALLAKIHAGSGRGDRAVEILEKLAAAEPEVYPADQALWELALLYQQRGDTTQARAAWQRIVDQFPGRPTAATARERLGS